MKKNLSVLFIDKTYELSHFFPLFSDYHMQQVLNPQFVDDQVPVLPRRISNCPAEIVSRSATGDQISFVVRNVYRLLVTFVFLKNS